MPAEVLHQWLLPMILPYAINLTSRTAALSDDALRLCTQILRVVSWKRSHPCDRICSLFN
jgi:hypothetical protein